MARRSNPTARQVRLGKELRKLRLQAGVSAVEAARVLSTDQARMSHLEAGRSAVGEERVRRLAAHYGVSDPSFEDALVAMDGDRAVGWWEQYRDAVSPLLLDLAEYENHAHRLRVLQVVHIPGLLQTEGYARAVLAHATPEMTAAEIDRHVAFRMARRHVLDQPRPPALCVLIHEAALRIMVGDRRVAKKQLDHLLEAAEHPAVRLRVVPFETEKFNGSGFPMMYMEGGVRQLDTAQFDTVHGSVFVDGQEELSRYRGVLDRTEQMSLTGIGSRDLILHVSRQL